MPDMVLEERLKNIRELIEVRMKNFQDDLKEARGDIKEMRIILEGKEGNNGMLGKVNRMWKERKVAWTLAGVVICGLLGAFGKWIFEEFLAK